ASPDRLELPLRLGVTVIIAHLGSVGKTGGKKNFEMVNEMLPRYANLYTDNSATTEMHRAWALKASLKQDLMLKRMVYGSDWPVMATPVVSYNYFLPRLGFKKIKEIKKNKNIWDQDVELKKALGLPAESFERSEKIIRQ
ncbi:MAG: amidohydrolase family protein, partial [Pseudomonadota bacterium]